MESSEPSRNCELCGRRVRRLTAHHLIPRVRHRSRSARRLFTKEEMRQSVIMLCRPCHKTIHATLTEKELERDYPTRETLLANPEIAAFVEWIRDKPDGGNIRVYSTGRLREQRRGRSRRRGR